MSIKSEMNKEDVLHRDNGILLSHWKEWNNAICSNMDGPRVYQTKWSKLERKRQIPRDITLHVESKIWYKWTYLQNRSKLTDIENKFMVTKGAGRNKLGIWD